MSLSADLPIRLATFNAYQMRDLIIRQLTSDPSIRDQVYPGSNLSILIDLVATMYQTLTYQLNHAASESMFSQSQYYENIVRLARLIGYSAQGITPSTAMFRIDDPSAVYADDPNANGTIPPFAMVATSEGKYYSYSPYSFQGCQIPQNLDDGQPFDLLLHNGMWKRYRQVLTPTGQDFETFVLTSVGSDVDQQKYATTAHVYAVEVVKEYRADNPDEVDWSATTVRVFHPTMAGLFKGLPNTSDSDSVHSFLYNGVSDDDSCVFNVELNELRQLTIRFGDGVTTRKLTPGSELYVFYLETQGLDGAIQASDEQLKFTHSASMLGIDDGLYSALFGSTMGASVEGVEVHALTSSTSAVREETPDQIRERAPNWFKMNNRLVTKSDYEFFLRNEPSISGLFADVKAMNNWEYVSTFYRWLNQLGVNRHQNPRYYLNPARFVKYGGATLADAVDSNNVYVWYMTSFGDVDDIDYSQLVQRCKSMMADIKDVCQEPVLIPAIPVRCEISSVPLELGRSCLQTSGSTTVPTLRNSSGETNPSSWLEVRLDGSHATSSSEVVDRVCSLFTWFFDVRNHQVGFGSFDTSDLTNLILEKIPAVTDVYTAYQESPTASPIYTHGLSMSAYVDNSVLLDLGDDLQTKSGHIDLQDFQFPVLYTNTENELRGRIRVVNRSMNPLSRSGY